MLKNTWFSAGSQIAGSSTTGNPDIDKALRNIVANAMATSAGAVVGGDAGAFSAYNVDRFSRRLHDDDKTPRKKLTELARQQGLPYTEADINNQQVLMNMSDKVRLEMGGDYGWYPWIRAQKTWTKNCIGHRRCCCLWFYCVHPAEEHLLPLKR
jgi:hypothetical protein